GARISGWAATNWARRAATVLGEGKSMSEDKLNFLGGDSAPPPDGPAGPAPVDESVDGPHRAPDGRFLTAVPVTESVSPKASEDRPFASDTRLREDGHVPISALLDEREKRQAERAQREALELQIADMR